MISEFKTMRSFGQMYWQAVLSRALHPSHLFAITKLGILPPRFRDGDAHSFHLGLTGARNGLNSNHARHSASQSRAPMRVLPRPVSRSNDVPYRSGRFG